MKEYKSSIKQYSLSKNASSILRAKITSSKDAYNYIKQFYNDDIDIYESFFLLLLNNSNNTVGYAKISQGGITGTVVDLRIIAKYCIESLCPACILAHNHPSGKTTPSKSDKDVTKKITDGLKMLDIKVIDHVILTSENGFYSFADNSEQSIS